MLEFSENSPVYESDHDLDKQLDDGPLDPLFGTAGQFRVIHKLGRGGLATVWLCRDQETQKYVALKIIIADESRDESSELWLANREGLDFGEAGGEYIAVPREYFWLDGPNGRHLCLVLPASGPRVSALWGAFKDPASVSRDIALQVTRGLHFLHKNGICHGDFRPSNILLRLYGFNDLSEQDLLGEPNKEPLVTISEESPAPSGPEYLVDSLNLDRLPARFTSDQISIIDFGESYDMHSPPADLGITASFRSPELLFDNTRTIGVGCDFSRAQFTKFGQTAPCLRISWTTTTRSSCKWCRCLGSSRNHGGVLGKHGGGGTTRVRRR
ncbi:Protein kinase dsk1 [Lachnellula arida]|uniref:EKC/KEOPS complex subunit BUD32 n=1 Tax=Lachnellula arida TaxID=1316785 RepID=A0A8T9B056_9HELO|nr:Protein kinase dsk1 [Lachnellula arida]